MAVLRDNTLWPGRVGGGYRTNGARCSGRQDRRTQARVNAQRPSRFHRLVLRAYPRWFIEEYGDQLIQHLAYQRGEARYAAGIWGALRFWWDAGSDAVMNGAALRLDRWVSRNSNENRGGVGRMMDAFKGDVRVALRGLIKNPGYALVFIVTLGLGIGANTAMFSAVNGVLLRPLPHADGDRLVYLRHSAALAGIENALFSVPEIDEYRRGMQSLEAIAEFSALDFTMLGYDTPRRVRAGIVTGNYFGVMGLTASLGRMVDLDDDGEVASAVVVLSDAYWRSAFGADPGIIGKTVEINGRIATFVGVAEPAPPYPERTDIYVNMAASPHHLSASMSHDRVHRMTEVFAKLAPSANVEMARAEAKTVTSRVHAEHPEAYDAGSGFGVSVTPLKTQLTSRARPTFLLLLGTAFFVLLIACANLANLTLTRVLRRDRELAIRTSLGASRASLRRGLLVESLILAGAGAALGLLLASVSLDLLVVFAERFTSRASEISLDASVFGFALLAAITASIFFTLLPPLPTSDSVGGSLTRSGSRTTVGSRAKRAQRVLVVAQIGTSFVLLIGAGLLTRTMIHLNRVDPGFDTEQILSMEVPPNSAGRSEDELRTHYLDVLEDVRALPGVEGASLTSAVPLAGAGTFTTHMEMKVEGHETPPGAPKPRADFRVVTPGYFSMMGIEVVAGREFTSTDGEDGRDVVLINESLARAYFGDRDPIGQQIAWTDDVLKFIGLERDYRSVVGVVADTRDAGLDAEVMHAMYNPYRQVTPQFTSALVVRVRGNVASVTSDVREAILSHDPNQPIVRVATIAELGSESVAPRRLNTTLLGAFAVLALLIAAVGIGGVLAFSVGTRTREFGVRSALGAARHQIGSAVLLEGALLAAMGVGLGSLGAVVLTRFMSSLLVGVPALDPVTFVAVGLTLSFVAVAACWVPAWRAAAVSPLEALGSE